MTIKLRVLPFFLLILGVSSAVGQSAAPHLENRGAATQLIVDGKPFLILGGELHNSSSSSLEYMKPLWPRLAALGLNTVVTPLSWELVEPAEGKYDFTLVDGLLGQARAAHERVVFLWLATWKNGMSSYAPLWVKQDTKRFQRVMAHGNEVEVLSPMGAATQEADARAFAALMQHIKDVDGTEHTVLMMQVENEVGVLGDTRDHSTAANRAFAGPVPAELIAYLKGHHDGLYQDLRELWDANGRRMAGTWAEVFGDTPRADEIFMAWQYARFIHGVTARGKAAYNIPMYVNVWLMGENSLPGDYPSGCPEPRVMDVWKAAGQAIDFFAPDLYAENFAQWCRRFHREGNPLFMPEARGGVFGSANVFYALGEEDGLGFSPFGIEDETAQKSDLTASYAALANITPMLTERQSAGAVHGFVLSKEQPSADFVMNGVEIHVELDDIFGMRSTRGFGLIMATGPEEFVGIGRGFMATFAARSHDGKLGIAAVEEGVFADGKWVPGRRFNGDEDDQGKAWHFGTLYLEEKDAAAGWRVEDQSIRMEKLKLYRYE